MMLIAVILLALYIGFYSLSLTAIFKGKLEYVLYYSAIFFPVYTVFLAINYDVFESKVIVSLLQYSKELLIFGALGIWLLGQKNVLRRNWFLSSLDYCFIGFIVLSLVYFVLPIGEASFLNKAIYFKNILLIGVFYFLGRNVTIDFSGWGNFFKIVFTLSIVAVVIVLFEKLFATHFHSLIGYAKYNQVVKGVDPGGVFGLTFTFEAQDGQARYGAFFANPLEFSASMLIVVASSIILFLSVPFKSNKYKYLFFLACAFICVVLAFSRATFLAFFLMLMFIAFLLKYYRILWAVFGVGLALTLYVAFFAADEVRYFVIDTITFENSSSVTHIIDWLEAVESMISNPMGIGLATSGNAGGVEKDLQVGGENQYLIYGVQLGFIGLVLYLAMLLIGISHAWKAFRLAPKRELAMASFVAASVKFGLLLPLFTANAEAYLFVSLISWWLIGQAETTYQTYRLRNF
ncbi:MAG: hypothetical protein ACI9Z3_001158 [Roseivirga sp.]|jgi:hypothetical protein